MWLFLAAACFAVGAVLTLIATNYKNYVVWVLAGVALYIASGVDFAGLTN